MTRVVAATGLALLFAVGACSLLVDTSGLSGVAAEPGTSGDGSASDATNADAMGTDATGTDGGLDGAAAADGDAGSTQTDASTYVAEVMSDTPLAYFRMGETAGTVAVSLGGSQPTMTGAYASSPLLGVPGAIVNDPNTAVSFLDNGSAHLDIANVAAKVGNVQYSIELWAKQAGAPNGAVRYYFDREADDGTTKYRLFVNGTNNLIFERAQSDGSADGVYPTFIPTLGTWNHIVVTTGGTVMRLYVNGVQIGQGAVTLTFGETTGQFVVGTNATSFGSNMAGATIDEIAFYGTVLTPARVLAHYNAGLGN